MVTEKKLLPFVKDSDTSKSAADSMMKIAPAQKAQVYDLIYITGEDGMTDDELEFALGAKHQTISARRRDLVIEGRVKDSGNRRKTRSDRWATVWVTVPESQVRQHRQNMSLEMMRNRIKDRVNRATLSECIGVLRLFETIDG